MSEHHTSHAGIRSLLVILFALFACNVPALAQVTSLTLISDAGDYVGGGQFYFFTPADGTFTAQQNFDQGVSISFNTPSFDQFWNLDFAAPNNQPLTPGIYSGAARFPFQASNQPGLSVVGDGRGCNTLAGSFQAHSIGFWLAPISLEWMLQVTSTITWRRRAASRCRRRVQRLEVAHDLPVVGELPVGGHGMPEEGLRRGGCGGERAGCEPQSQG